LGDSDDEEHGLEEVESEEDDVIAMLPREVLERVNKLKELNETREKIMEDYLSERAELEKKFASRCKPLYDRRAEIVTGKLDESIKALTVAAPDETAEKDAEEKAEDGTIKGIPQFWVCAMGHLETVAELITEQDVDCLEHLVDVTCDDFPDGKGFFLNFIFSENDYFENDVLTKRYEIPNLLLDDEPILKSVTGCEIKWKPGRALTHRDVLKKQRNKSGKRAGQIRTVLKRERTDSFFHFFNPPKLPSLEEMDEEEADAIEEAFDHDYDVAQSFRSHIIPKAVLWFTGEAVEEEMVGVFNDSEFNTEQHQHTSPNETQEDEYGSESGDAME